MIPIMKQTDILPGPQRRQEINQRARPFGELKHVQLLIPRAAATADEIANMRFSQFVAGDVGSWDPLLAETGDESWQVGGAGRGVDGDAHEDVSGLGVGVAVAEFGDALGQDGFDEFGEGARTFGQGEAQEGFFLLAERGAFGDESEAVEVHVRARGDCDEGAVRIRVRVGGDVFFQTGQGEGAGWFDDGARVFEDVFDRGADFVGGDFDYVVDDFAAYAECLFADGLDGGAVGEEADFGEEDSFALVDGLGHGVCVVGFDADYLDVGGDAFDVDAYSGDEAAAADAAEDCFQVLEVGLSEDFHSDRALAGDDVGVIEWWDVC